MIIINDDDSGKKAYIFHRPLIESFTINYQNNIEDLYYLGGKVERCQLMPDMSADIKLRMLGIDLQSATDIKPEDLYTLPELIKLSKRIIRKIK